MQEFLVGFGIIVVGLGLKVGHDNYIYHQTHPKKDNAAVVSSSVHVAKESK